MRRCFIAGMTVAVLGLGIRWQLQPALMDPTQIAIIAQFLRP